jgi:DNA-binding CsgD family transcriptional regulator
VPSPAIAVIADIVGSRQLADRSTAQHAIERSIASIDDALPLAQVRMTATVGDEFEAVFEELDEALAWILLLQLWLPDGLQLRFGVGVGPVGAIASVGRDIPEGPGWWAAREAIEHVHARQQRAVPSARTWVVADAGEDESMHSAVRLANAYLLARDQLIGAMTERERRLTYGRCRGVTQRELARVEGITQPAVSQALAAAGSAVIVEGMRALQAEATA